MMTTGTPTLVRVSLTRAPRRGDVVVMAPAPCGSGTKGLHHVYREIV